VTVASYACPVPSEAGKTAPDAPKDPATAAVIEAAGALGAWRLAAAAHAGQRRDANLRPYIQHPERVAVLVAGEGGDDAMVAAALLHDVIEDTEIEIERIEREFGADVAALVAAMTDDRTIGDYEARKDALRDQVREAGERAALIYASDKLANSSDLRGAYGEIGEDVAGRLKISLDGRIRIWRDDLEMCRELLGERAVVGDLDAMLTGLEDDRRRAAAA
jgi:hypothetical protein